jgi:exonuclease SbcD
MGSPIRVMHFADTHFGVETYGRLDPATGLNTRLIDFRESLCRAIDAALAEGVQLALFAGDAYKSRDPSQTHQREFASCIRRLTDAGVPVVMLTGNHDIPNVRGRAHSMEIYRTLGVREVHIFQRPELLVIDTPGGPAQIAAMPYLMKGFMLARDEYLGKTADEVRQIMEQKYTNNLNDLAERADRSLPTVLMGHFWVRGARLSAWQQGYFNVNEPQVNLSDLSRPDVFDYVALGHIHKHQTLNRESYPPVVYSGSPDCIDFGERREAKGYVLVVLAKGSTTYRFVEVPGARKLLDIEVDADNDSPTETILEEISKHALRGNIVRLTYRLSSERLPLVREKEIREALLSAFLIVAIRADVQRDHVARSRVLTESLDPLAALGHYLDATEKGRKRKPELIPYAELLMEELRRVEAFA